MAAVSWTFWRSTAKTSNLDLSVRRPSVRTPRQAPRRHYEAWLDYVYYSSKGLRLVGYQESLSEEQAQLIYRDGDALPNAWHPSDHLPVGCVFQWADSIGSGATV